jgi:hypothetical protein
VLVLEDLVICAMADAIVLVLVVVLVLEVW